MTASDSFHETSISITQHIFHPTPTYLDIDVNRAPNISRPLSCSYTDIRPIIFKTKQLQSIIVYGWASKLPDAKDVNLTEHDWLQAVQLKWESSNMELEKGQVFSWSAYHDDQVSEYCEPGHITK